MTQITLSSDQLHRIEAKVDSGLSGSTYEALVAILGPREANQILGGNVPARLPSEAINAILGTAPPAAEPVNVTVQGYDRAVRDLIQREGLSGRVTFGELYRTRGAVTEMLAIPKPGRGYALYVDAQRTEAKLDLGHWNMGFRTDADATEGYRRVERALAELR